MSHDPTQGPSLLAQLNEYGRGGGWGVVGTPSWGPSHPRPPSRKWPSKFVYIRDKRVFNTCIQDCYLPNPQMTQPCFAGRLSAAAAAAAAAHLPFNFCGMLPAALMST
eukprot:1143746-Pelagomonas_calceolata.AAC.1